MSANVVASIVQNGTFGGRNFLLGSDANQNNQVRLLVSAGQMTNLLRAGEKSANSIFQKTSVKILEGCAKIAQNDKTLSRVGKVVDFASKNVNNLIVVSSIYRAATAKDKQTELIAQAGNVGGMFAVEGWMKKNLAQHIDKLPIPKKLKPIVQGLTFVFGSITGSTICYKIAKAGALKLKEANEHYQKYSL